MSRTIRGSKGVGYEYWSARPLNKGGGFVSKFTKTQTSRIERRNNKTLVAKELDDFDDLDELDELLGDDK